MKLKRICAVLLIVLLLAPAALAAEPVDPDRTGSISVTLRETDGKTPVPGGALTVYFVAALDLENGNEVLRYTAPFADYGVAAETLLTALPAEDLDKWAKEHGAAGDTVTVDGQGSAAFSDLKLGLYLVVQTTPAPGRAAVKPFLVSVPARDGDQILYDVDASPKVSAPGAPTVTPTPAPSGDKLPQTGQLWWPVPVLAVLGLLCVALGWRKRT